MDKDNLEERGDVLALPLTVIASQQKQNQTLWHPW